MSSSSSTILPAPASSSTRLSHSHHRKKKIESWDDDFDYQVGSSSSSARPSPPPSAATAVNISSSSRILSSSSHWPAPSSSSSLAAVTETSPTLRIPPSNSAPSSSRIYPNVPDDSDNDNFDNEEGEEDEEEDWDAEFGIESLPNKKRTADTNNPKVSVTVTVETAATCVNRGKSEWDLEIEQEEKEKEKVKVNQMRQLEEQMRNSLKIRSTSGGDSTEKSNGPKGEGAGKGKGKEKGKGKDAKSRGNKLLPQIDTNRPWPPVLSESTSTSFPTPHLVIPDDTEPQNRSLSLKATERRMRSRSDIPSDLDTFSLSHSTPTSTSPSSSVTASTRNLKPRRSCTLLSISTSGPTSVSTSARVRASATDSKGAAGLKRTVSFAFRFKTKKNDDDDVGVSASQSQSQMQLQMALREIEEGRSEVVKDQADSRQQVPHFIESSADVSMERSVLDRSNIVLSEEETVRQSKRSKRRSLATPSTSMPASKNISGKMLPPSSSSKMTPRADNSASSSILMMAPHPVLPLSPSKTGNFPSSLSAHSLFSPLPSSAPNSPRRKVFPSSLSVRSQMNVSVEGEKAERNRDKEKDKDKDKDRQISILKRVTSFHRRFSTSAKEIRNSSSNASLKLKVPVDRLESAHPLPPHPLPSPDHDDRFSFDPAVSPRPSFHSEISTSHLGGEHGMPSRRSSRQHSSQSQTHSQQYYQPSLGDQSQSQSSYADKDRSASHASNATSISSTSGFTETRASGVGIGIGFGLRREFSHVSQSSSTTSCSRLPTSPSLSSLAFHLPTPSLNSPYYQNQNQDQVIVSGASASASRIQSFASLVGPTESSGTNMIGDQHIPMDEEEYGLAINPDAENARSDALRRLTAGNSDAITTPIDDDDELTVRYDSARTGPPPTPEPTLSKKSTRNRLSSLHQKHRRRISETWQSITNPSEVLPPPSTSTRLRLESQSSNHAGSSSTHGSSSLLSPPTPTNVRSLSHTGSPSHILPTPTDDPVDIERPSSRHRRNSLGDLRVPSTVLAAQRGLRQGSEALKKFAAGVQELQRLVATHEQLLETLKPHPEVNTIKEHYAKSWILAQTLVDLGFGAPNESTEIDIKRERRITLAASHSTPINSFKDRRAWRASTGRQGFDEEKLSRLRDVLTPSQSDIVPPLPRLRPPLPQQNRRSTSRSGLAGLLGTWIGKPSMDNGAGSYPQPKLRPSLAAIFRKQSSTFSVKKLSKGSNDNSPRSSTGDWDSAESMVPYDSSPTLLLTPGNLPVLIQKLNMATSECQRCIDDLQYLYNRAR